MYQSKQKPIPVAVASQASTIAPSAAPFHEPKPQMVPQEREPHPFRPVGNFPLKIRKIENKPVENNTHVGENYNLATDATPIVGKQESQAIADLAKDSPEQIDATPVATMPKNALTAQATEQKSNVSNPQLQDSPQENHNFFHYPVFSASSAFSVSAKRSVPTQGNPSNEPQMNGTNGTNGTDGTDEMNQTNSPAPSNTTAQHTGYFAQPIDQLPMATQQRLLEAYDSFVSENSSTGQIKVQTFLAQQAYPLGDVNLIISKRFHDIEYVFYELQTNATGISDNITLPAPPRANSQQPYQQDPFTTYLITAYKQGFISEEPYEIEIFEGIKAIQPIEMLPLIRKVEDENEKGQEA